MRPANALLCFSKISLFKVNTFSIAETLLRGTMVNVSVLQNHTYIVSVEGSLKPQIFCQSFQDGCGHSLIFYSRAPVARTISNVSEDIAVLFAEMLQFSKVSLELFIRCCFLPCFYGMASEMLFLVSNAIFGLSGPSDDSGRAVPLASALQSRQSTQRVDRHQVVTTHARACETRSRVHNTGKGPQCFFPGAESRWQQMPQADDIRKAPS